jgi:hypothetical protein
LRCKMHKAM